MSSTLLSSSSVFAFLSHAFSGIRNGKGSVANELFRCLVDVEVIAEAELCERISAALTIRLLSRALA